MGKVRKKIPLQEKSWCHSTRQMNTSTGENILHMKYINTAGGLLWSRFMLHAYFKSVLWRVNGLLQHQAKVASPRAGEQEERVSAGKVGVSGFMGSHGNG